MPTARWLTLPPELWDDPAVAAALGALDFGALFRVLIARSGATQEDLGLRVDLSQSAVSAIIRGERTITTIRVARNVVDGLDLPDRAFELLVLGAFGRARPPAGSEEDEMRRRDMIRAGIATALSSGIAVSGALGDEVSAAARRPDPTTADHLRSLVQQVRELDDTAPVGTLVPMAGQLAAFCVELLRTAPEPLRADIGRVAAEAAMANWWQNWQARGDADPEAGQLMELAIEWDALALVGYLLARRSWTALAAGDLLTAVRLARSAREPRWGLSPGGIGWAAEHEARALALIGDDDGLARSLDIAEGALAAASRDTEPAWLYWLADGNPGEMATVRLLREGPDAASAMEAALAGRPADQVRDNAWFRAEIAAARARAGDDAGAARDAETAARLAAASGAGFVVGELGLLARRPHLPQLRTVLADHGLLSA